MNERVWRVIGLMSGTSLDGLDVALCNFVTVNQTVIEHEIVAATTYRYSQVERQQLNLMSATALEFARADAAFGQYCGERVLQFMADNKVNADLVASHGHTVFHQPSNGFTSQIGNGAILSAKCGLPVVCDFRSVDVALGGQGAPLVPIGDFLLFSEYKYCLNLGGIANISVKDDVFKAFDICPANIPLNLLAQQLGKEFDANGAMAEKGCVYNPLLAQLDGLDYYSQLPPKSLGKEWVDRVFWPLIIEANCSLEDKLATVTVHIANQISKVVLQNGSSGSSILVTGGGAFNRFLIQQLEERLNSNCRVVIPSNQLIGFKEALIFAFLGLLRVWNKPNALQTVTGAQTDSIGGALYGRFYMGA